MYDAVTRCLRWQMHNSATDAWNATGRRLRRYFQPSILSLYLGTESRNTPNDDVRICDQPLYSFRIPHIHEHRHRIIVRRGQTLGIC